MSRHNAAAAGRRPLCLIHLFGDVVISVTADDRVAGGDVIKDACDNRCPPLVPRPFLIVSLPIFPSYRRAALVVPSGARLKMNGDDDVDDYIRYPAVARRTNERMTAKTPEEGAVGTARV